MRLLSAVPNIETATPDYPNGRVRDKAGAVSGTTYSEILHGDSIQFFQKLIIDAGITPNGNPDNVANGYELITALKDMINKNTGFRASSTTIINSAMTTSEQDVCSVTPSATKGSLELKSVFTCQFKQPSSGSNTTGTFRLYSGGVLKHTIVETIFVDGRTNIITFSFPTAYVANDLVKVTFQLAAGTSIIQKADLISDAYLTT